MNNENPEAALHRVMTAVLAKLMQLPPPGTHTQFTVASAVLNEGDPAFERLMHSTADAKVDMLIAIVERCRGGTSAQRLVLITTTDNVTIAQEVDPARIAPDQPVVLVSADRRRVWQLRHGRLKTVELPSQQAIERGIEAAIAEIGDLLAEAALTPSDFVAQPIASNRDVSASC